MSLVECRAPARRPKYDGQTCGGFVMQAPVPVRVAGIIPHSERARRGAWVGRCSSCGAVHEVMPEEALEEA